MDNLGTTTITGVEERVLGGTEMWVKINFADFSFTFAGFTVGHKGERTLLVSPGLERLQGIGGLRRAEYGAAVEIDPAARSVAFGRDYLGHYPLLYAVSENALFIGDELGEVRAHVLASGGRLSISEEALALYFSMGYVPQGMTLLEQVVACENASIYRYQKGSVRRESLFIPIDEDASFPLEELGREIRAGVAKVAGAVENVDVWCSGGLDSAIIARLFNIEGRHARVLTMGYDADVQAQYGAGEIPYAQAVADHCGVPLTIVPMTREAYVRAHAQVAARHIGPVFDVAILPKYVLATGTRACAATGEGGDPLFAGVKNTPILFMRTNDPAQSLGFHYAAIHNRLFDQLETFFVRGRDLKAYVVEYFDRLFDAFPGSLVRKLFYINTFAKQGGLIFPENYYAGKRAGVSVRHPLTGLGAYEAAFRLADERKYRYPNGKLALIDLFGSDLPQSVVARRKSGTRVPLDLYLTSVLDAGGLGLATLHDVDAFRPGALAQLERLPVAKIPPLHVNAFVTLNNWLSHQGENDEPVSVSRSSCHHH